MAWFRFYTDTIQDRKIRRLSLAHRWLWVAVLSLAKESPVQGTLLVSHDLPVDAGDLADAGALTIEDVESGLKEFESLDMIHWDGDVIVVTNWDTRQFTSDSSADRTRKYRDNIRNQGATVTGYTKHRHRVYERDNHMCVYCGSSKNLCLDHVIPVSLGGDDDPDNLATSCKSCNSGKSGRTPEMANMEFITDEAKELYKRNLSRLQRQGVTVTVTPHITETEKEIKRDVHPDGYTPEFESFWSKYPNKKGKKAAYKCWNTLLKAGVNALELTNCAQLYADECKKDNTQPRYILHGTTFLGQSRRYEDYLNPQEADEDEPDEPVQKAPTLTPERLEEMNKVYAAHFRTQ